MPAPIARERITGLILAGGQGSRMGSVDKGLQPFRGRPLVAHALSRLAPQVGTILLSAHRHRDAYRGFGHRVVHDTNDRHEGPLAGIAAGLAACRTDYLVTVPCDAPAMPLDLVAKLAGAFDDPSVRICIARAGAHPHPVFCMMRADVAASLDAFFAEGGRSVRAWVESLHGVAVDFDDAHAFRNLNTQDELHDAEHEPRAATPTADRPPMLRYQDAQALIDGQVEGLADFETVALVDAAGRVLARDVRAELDVPAHDNAAMDGYAMASASDPEAGFVDVGQAYAGHPFEGRVGIGECVRIMTGAVIPDGCDAVVPFEDATVVGKRVVVNTTLVAGRHRRLAGEDLRAGEVALARGRRITPSDMGLAASIGADTLDVVRRPRIAVFSTGSELRAFGQPLERGAIRDSNRYTLIGMLKGLGVDVLDLGIVADDPDALDAAIGLACAAPVLADAVIASGGVSAGDADHTRETMRRLGSVSFWKLAIKPGRPMAFGRIATDGRNALFFGLPGNPVAVMVVFYALVRDALLKLMGATPEPMPSITAVCDTPLPKASGRTEFIRGIAVRELDGWHVRTTGAQGSGILHSMSDANCLIVLDHDRGPVARGETVEAWPFRGLV